MKVRGRLLDANLSLQGELTISFSITDKAKALRQIDEIKDLDLDIEVSRHTEKRSLSANAYLWVLCDKIAKHPHIKSDKWTIYLMMLKEAGVFCDCQIRREALDTLKTRFRYIEILDEDDYSFVVRCYFGSSTYNSREMGDLLDKVKEEAMSLGIDVWTDDEIKAAVAAWKGNGDGNSY